MSGINTLKDLMDRCRVDEITGCWEFNTPHISSVRFPPLRARHSLGKIIAYLKTGSLPPKGVFWYCTCETKGCANPDHRTPGSKKKYMRHHAKPVPPARRAKIAATLQAKSSIPDAVIQEIRSSSETLEAVAQKFGLSVTYCSRIRRGERRTQLVAPGASVFTLAQANVRIE